HGTMLPPVARRRGGEPMLRLVVLALASVVGIAAAHEIDRWSVDGGSGRSEGGPFALHATIGQPDAGILTSDRFVIAGGFWFPSFAVTAVDPGGSVLDDRMVVHAATPNPFNPTTHLRLDLPRPTHVKVEIYDLRGRVVRTLLDESRAAGQHHVRWDGRSDGGRGVASGTYLVCVRGAEVVVRQKISLVR
ncbi:T9SS type A sorting domain-containing protein, partial [bacterium]|nr:T9SS type A sorting domain-containing protein [bacterium]